MKPLRMRLSDPQKTMLMNMYNKLHPFDGLEVKRLASAWLTFRFLIRRGLIIYCERNLAGHGGARYALTVAGIYACQQISNNSEVWIDKKDIRK